MSSPVLELQVTHRQGPMTLDAGFALAAPWTVLFGPSGSGKTTLLRTIAGFVRPDRGRVVQHRSSTECLLDTKTRTFVPAFRRAIRFSAQSTALFPQKNVLENIAYGAKNQSDEANALSIVEDALDRFHLRSLAHKFPRDLSGGEKQQVAVVRAATAAISTGPRTLLLLDEPFAGLDMVRRDEFVTELQQWLGQMDIPVLSVTHDVGEAFLLQAEIIKIADGRVVEQGPVEQVLAAERRRLLGQLRS